jgi:hypothetical protein
MAELLMEDLKRAMGQLVESSPRHSLTEKQARSFTHS